MEFHGVSASEADVHLATGGDEEGATVAGLIAAARFFGFPKTKEIRLTQPESEVFDELEILTQDHYPIAYLKRIPSRDIDSHAVIVLGVDEREVFLIDPLAGERYLPRNRFLFEWDNANRRLIVIQR